MRTRSLFLILTTLVVVAITSIGAIPSSVTGALAIGGTCIAAKMLLVKVVTTGDECLIERLGRFDRKIGPGWNLVVRPIEKVSAQTTLREQVLDILPQQCYTLDK
jgi:regulator of protease activity HflC (stomatin/prohibitin superfamily)